MTKGKGDEGKERFGARLEETNRERMMSARGEGRNVERFLLIKKRSTTRGDGINQSLALMRHLLIRLK